MSMDTIPTACDKCGRDCDRPKEPLDPAEPRGESETLCVECRATSPAGPTDRGQLLRYYDSVFEDINGFLTEKDDEKRDERREQLGPLCFMKRIEWKIQIAWGGPEYGFKLYYDPECREWLNGVFYWADWFKYEEESLSPDEMEKVVEAYSMESVVE